MTDKMVRILSANMLLCYGNDSRETAMARSIVVLAEGEMETDMLLLAHSTLPTIIIPGEFDFWGVAKER